MLRPVKKTTGCHSVLNRSRQLELRHHPLQIGGQLGLNFFHRGAVLLADAGNSLNHLGQLVNIGSHLTGCGCILLNDGRNRPILS